MINEIIRMSIYFRSQRIFKQKSYLRRILVIF